jgi:hypothetical protein
MLVDINAYLYMFHELSIRALSEGSQFGCFPKTVLTKSFLLTEYKLAIDVRYKI